MEHVVFPRTVDLQQAARESFAAEAVALQHADGGRVGGHRCRLEPVQMQRLEPDVAVIADSATACRLLAERLRRAVAPSRERAAEIAAAKRVAEAAIDRLQPQAAFLRAIRAVLPRDGILVPELSQVGFATYTGAFPVLAPRTYISEGFQGTLGFGFPTALGAKVANRDKAVVSVTGDGGFMFGVQELATAAQYGIALVTIVFNVCPSIIGLPPSRRKAPKAYCEAPLSSRISLIS